MLPEAYSAVMQARSRDEFRDEIVRFARALGFETVSAMTVLDHGLATSDFIVVDNTPQAYLDTFSDPGSGRKDPVMQHCRRQSVPIIWTRDTYAGAACRCCDASGRARG